MKYLSSDGKQFDYKSWVNDYQRWKGNKELLKFTAIPSFDEKKVSVTFENAPEKYKKALIQLTSNIIDGALYWMSLFYTKGVSQKDSDSEKKRFKEEVDEKVLVLINTLLDDGIDAFQSLLGTFSTIYRLQYELKHLQYKDGEWYNWEDYKWNGKLWEKQLPNGTVLTAPCDESIKSFLPYPKKTECKNKEKLTA